MSMRTTTQTTRNSRNARCNPNDDGPSKNPDNSDNDVQHNLADAVAALARNVQHQGDGLCSKVREPDPFDGTDPTSSTHSLFSYNSVSMTDLAFSLMIDGKSTSQSHISRASHFSLNWIWTVCQFGVMIMMNSFQS